MLPRHRRQISFMPIEHVMLPALAVLPSVSFISHCFQLVNIHSENGTWDQGVGAADFISFTQASASPAWSDPSAGSIKAGGASAFRILCAFFQR